MLGVGESAVDRREEEAPVIRDRDLQYDMLFIADVENKVYLKLGAVLDDPDAEARVGVIDCEDETVCAKCKYERFRA